MIPRSPRGSQRRPYRRAAALVAVVAAAGSLTACGSGDGTTPATTTKAGSCPAKIVSQLSWFPDPTHAAFLTPLVDPKFSVGKFAPDNNKLTVTGRVKVPGLDQPVTWEVRAGGPAKGRSSVADLMYTDKSITLGQQATEEQVQAAAAARSTLSVLAPLDQDPVGYAWDPTVFPDFHSIADVGMTDTTVLAYQASSLDYLTGQGILRARQVDTGFTGSPEKFLAARGRMVVAGFGTGLPYDYAHLAPYAANRTMEFAYLSDEGYPSYRNLVTIRTGDRTALDWCLRKIVPVMEQAQVDFMANPDPTLQMVEQLNTAWRNPEPWSVEKGRYAWQTMRDRALVSNGKNGFGAVDLRTGTGVGGGRIAQLLAILVPNFRAQKVNVPDLTPGDLATNDYLNPRIKLPTTG